MPEDFAGLNVPQDDTGRKILLLAALYQEVQPFLRLSRARRRRGFPWRAWEFPTGRGTGLLALSGMGAGAAGEAAAYLVRQFKPHLLISVGFGGAVNFDLPAGALVLGENFYRFDPASGILDPIPPPAAARPLPELLGPLSADGLNVFPGSLITTTRIIHKAAQAGPLRPLAHPVLDLENSAVAAVARAAGLPFLGLRAVTDTAAEEIPEFLATPAGEPGGIGLLKALGWLASNPLRLRDLLHLWRRSRLASAQLARGLMILLPLLQ